MSRPIYENESTLAVERQTMRDFLEGYACFALKLPRRYELDWMVLQKDTRHLVAWVECKRRYCRRLHYPTFMISLRKWKEGLELSQLGGKPFYIVVQWDDGIFYVKPADVIERIEIAFAGRTDRMDPEDMEPCVFIPVSLFRPRTAASCASTPVADASES